MTCLESEKRKALKERRVTDVVVSICTKPFPPSSLPPPLLPCLDYIKKV